MTADEAEIIALRAVAWIVADVDRLSRLLAHTGLTLEGLRSAVQSPPALAGLLDWLARYEPDLIAFAQEEGLPPAEVATAAARLAAS